jgi:hypothetical protein
MDVQTLRTGEIMILGVQEFGGQNVGTIPD